MTAKMNSDKSLFRMRTLTAGVFSDIYNCCDARLITCAELRDNTKEKVVTVKQSPVSPCGDIHVDVTISLQHQHRGVTQHGSEGKRLDGGLGE